MHEIRGIFIDLGGTFRVVVENKPYSDAAKQRIVELVDTPLTAETFHTLIEERYVDYRHWAIRNACEAPEHLLWTRWLAYDCDRERLETHASKLTYLYRRCKGERVVVPGGVETVKELHRRGYTLGIISDLIGCTEIDEWLDADALRPYFSTVQQSSVTMLRKPHPAIYFQALQEAGVRPEEAVFVGDNLNRDIIGAKESDFGMTLGVEYPELAPLKLNATNMPDGVITRFTDLLHIFPGVPDVKLDAVYRRSLP
ncbi:MAG: HAD family hydrolase [Clostridiales bacterium]|nr:HAD family hydrolase [Clostridiales bacterium]